MSGTVMNLFTKRDFSFGASDTVVVVKHVAVGQYTEGTILVRGHTLDLGTGSSIDVKAYITAPSAEDPATEFDDETAVATATIATSTAAPYLAKGALSSGFGGFLKIKVEAIKGSGNCVATLSADLVVKA